MCVASSHCVMSWTVMSSHLTFCHIVECQITFMSCHGMSHNTWNIVECHVLSIHVTASRNVLSNLSCYVMLWYIKLHNNTCYYVSLYCFYRMLCRVNACHVMPCCIIRHGLSVFCAEVEGTYVFRHFIRRQLHTVKRHSRTCPPTPSHHQRRIFSVRKLSFSIYNWSESCTNTLSIRFEATQP